MSLRRRLSAAMLIAALLLLSSCSVVRLGYDHAPLLAWWWIDGYVDFNNEQTPHAKQAIQQWFVWHRNAQLPEYADWLAAIRSQLDGTLTSEQVCRWSEDIQTVIEPAFDYAAQLSVPVVLRLGESQWRHLEQRYTKSNDELRSDFLQSDLKERRHASIKRTVKRIKNLYGKVDETQRRLISASIDTSPFNPEAWMNERQRRQRETLSALRQLVAESTSAEQAEITLRRLIAHTYRSDDPEYRAYQIKLAEYTCDFIARMHNSASPNQRRHAHDKLKEWEMDLRALIMLDNRLQTALE